MLIELAFNVDGNNNLVFGDMRVHTDTAISSTEMSNIYSDVTSRITYEDAVNVGYTNTPDTTYFGFSYNKKYIYNGTTLTEDTPTLSTPSYTNAWIPDSDVGAR